MDLVRVVTGPAALVLLYGVFESAQRVPRNAKGIAINPGEATKQKKSESSPAPTPAPSP